jgi:rhodanese-related sulfurtransferase
MQQITPKDLKARIDAGESIMLLDVREDWEVDTASIPNAVNIPMNDVPDSLDSLPKDVPIAVVCHHGGRSAQVAYWLKAQGYDKVMNVSGGIDAWSQQVDPSVPRY